MSLLGASIRFLTNARALDVSVVDGAGNQQTGFDPSRPATATLASVPISTTSATLFTSNAARRQIFIFNDSNSDLFVAFAGTAAATSYTVLLPRNTQWESVLNGYTGTISGILAVGTGNARTTEIAT